MSERAPRLLNLLEHPAIAIDEDDELTGVLLAPASPITHAELDDRFDACPERAGKPRRVSGSI